MVCIDDTFDEFTKLELNAYLISYEDVNCDEPLINPVGKDDPVGMVIVLPFEIDN